MEQVRVISGEHLLAALEPEHPTPDHSVDHLQILEQVQIPGLEALEQAPELGRERVQQAAVSS
jgi:hypothetical protein